LKVKFKFIEKIKKMSEIKKSGQEYVDALNDLSDDEDNSSLQGLTLKMSEFRVCFVDRLSLPNLRSHQEAAIIDWGAYKPQWFDLNSDLDIRVVRSNKKSDPRLDVFVVLGMYIEDDTVYNICLCVNTNEVICLHKYSEVENDEEEAESEEAEQSEEEEEDDDEEEEEAESEDEEEGEEDEEAESEEGDEEDEEAESEEEDEEDEEEAESEEEGDDE